MLRYARGELDGRAAIEVVCTPDEGRWNDRVRLPALLPDGGEFNVGSRPGASGSGTQMRRGAIAAIRKDPPGAVSGDVGSTEEAGLIRELQQVEAV